MSRPLALAVLLAALAAAGCGSEGSEIDAAAEFDRFPVYWLGESFEGHDLESIDGLDETSAEVRLVYGECDQSDGGSCLPPLQLEISPLCSHLLEYSENEIWREREIRGAPLGSHDTAPVLFTQRVAVKVVRGQGSNRDSPLRALDVLHSLNEVEPFVGAHAPIPPPPEGVLEGDVPCTG